MNVQAAHSVQAELAALSRLAHGLDAARFNECRVPFLQPWLLGQSQLCPAS